MEDLKKPSLDKVIKRLESLDIREWVRKGNKESYEFTARISCLTIYVFKTSKETIRYFHKIRIVDRAAYVDYFKYGKKSVEEKSIAEFYEKLCKEYEVYHKKEFEEILEQVFSD